MFRKPREPGAPSSAFEVVGRPPSPHTAPAKTPFTPAGPPAVPPPTMTAKAKSIKPIPLPTIGRQGPTGSAKKQPLSKSKQASKGNSSILSFFKKSDSNGEAEAGLFVEDQWSQKRIVDGMEERHPTGELTLDDGDDARFHEAGGPVKRRKVSQGGPEERQREIFSAPRDTLQTNVTSRRSGPFLEESDSEQEETAEGVFGVEQAADEKSFSVGVEQSEPAGTDDLPIDVDVDTGEEGQVVPAPPAMIKEETSYAPDLNDFADFENMGDFDEDPFEEGDEYLERKYMEEQAMLEVEDEKDIDGLPVEENAVDEEIAADKPNCPICGITLNAISEQDAGVHVNNCLDGNPTPLPDNGNMSLPPSTIKPEGTTSASQYRRPERAPKPGQASPFVLGQSSGVSDGSAFKRLMSGHAEDSAWAEAAASERASHGKPSYQRTCPFYKILPGLSICVDAFRYGAVQGCQAYFLSHFHSDHYVGLTASWNHGPIYCSKVTANLVRQQLRVDARYVVPLDWETLTEVPGTKGVKVTMISANHCPGSSLFLFEKVVGKTQGGKPRLQRVLHCGDFRACRMHVQHPLLMPEVQDKVTGKTSEQKLDVCYLDTTYLNPKYAFPSQENVIRACAEMCICLSKDTPDEDDGWEQMKRQRAGEGMVKFVQKESISEAKEEPSNEEEIDNVKLEPNPRSNQQILSSVSERKTRGRLLVVVGTYSIGKERICLGIAKALKSKIYAPPSKQKIVAALEDPELDERMTNDPRAAQVHMTPLFEIRADTLDDYLKDFFPHFTRAVGFRPSGWNYRPPKSRFTESPLVQTVLHSDNWKSTYSMKELIPQRGSSSRASCFGVPYSEHSSFRELTMFCCALRIERIIPTVNVGNAKSRERMKAWCERWQAERKKNGFYRLPEDGSW